MRRSRLLASRRDAKSDRRRSLRQSFKSVTSTRSILYRRDVWRSIRELRKRLLTRGRRLCVKGQTIPSSNRLLLGSFALVFHHGILLLMRISHRSSLSMTLPYGLPCDRSLESDHRVIRWTVMRMRSLASEWQMRRRFHPPG